MASPSVAIFITPTASTSNLKRLFSNLGPSLQKAAEVFYIETGQGPHGQKTFPTYVKYFHHPMSLNYGDVLRLGLLHAVESKRSYVLLLNPNFPTEESDLAAFLTHVNGNDQEPALFAQPRMRTIRVPLAFQWGRARQHLFTRLLRRQLPTISSPLRLLSIELLENIPYLYNSSDYGFDTDLAIQLVSSGAKVKELGIQLKDEAWKVLEPLWPERLVVHRQLKSILKFHLMQWELFYDPKFDVVPFQSKPSHYMVKHAPTSIHHFMRETPIPPGSRLLDVGGGNGEAISLRHAKRGVDVTCIDMVASSENSEHIRFHKVDLDLPWLEQFTPTGYNYIFAMDVIEHLKNPEAGLDQIFRLLDRDGTLYASTGNVGFLSIRLMLLLGQFNYGRRGILDLTHRRLFTIGSFRRILRNSGFLVESIQCFGPPLLDISATPGFGAKALDFILSKLAQIFPSLFAFQFVAVCKRLDAPTELLPEIYQHQSREP
jgi:2-polyprenyl-3-methyl-5-hydroxy-6-metoxy-1,4-benzoquinol methylase